MLRRHHQIVVVGLFAVDALATFAAMVLAWWLRFRSGLIPLVHADPLLEPYLQLAPLALVSCLLCYRWQGLYRPRRTGSFFSELWDLLKATVAALFGIVAITFFLRSPAESRTVLALFFALDLALVGGARGAVRALLWSLRRRGYNLRHALIVGTGKLGRRVADCIARNPWTGLRVVGYLEASPRRRLRRVRKLPVLGTLEELLPLVEQHQIDQVFVALPLKQAPTITRVVRELEQAAVAVAMVPDVLELMTVGATTHILDGLPLVHLRQDPLSGYAMVAKRALDLVCASAALVLAAPLMAAIALAILVSDGPPVLYRQERMGLDGRRFWMLKFRTMRRDAEAQSGPVWARRDDPRTTRLGRWLRRLSLDELPQLFNVLKGEMSMVGPRPERPELIAEFKRRIPRYMLRHSVKAGITGWAQVNGWRGNTSLEKRIEHDLYYIEHWSLGFDLRIMALTLVRGLYHPNAY